MAEQANNKPQEEKQEAKTEEQAVKQKVELDAEQYNALLDRLAELESLAYKKELASRPVSLEDLAEEGKRWAPKEGEEEEVPTAKDLDELSNKELVEYIMKEVNRAGQQLLTEVQTLKVLREIDKCEAKYEDFWDYKDLIQEIAIQNPSLSIEQAYKLAKVSSEEKAKAKQEKSEAKEPLSQKLLKLPPRVAPGEKPGVAPGSTRSSEIKTLKDAALKAWDEVVGKGKLEI